MEVRKEFYVVTSVFDKCLSTKAIAVFAFLSYCADKNGECYPSVKRIAMECRLSDSTVRRAINELVSKGVISCSPRLMRTELGNRQTTNIYRLLVERGPRKKNEKIKELVFPASTSKQSKPEPSPAKPELPKPQTKPEAKLPSVGKAKARPDDDAEGLALLLGKLDLYRYYEDETACKALELAITDMWFAEETTVRGETINKYRMRMRLNELDIDAVDEIMDRLSDDDITNKTAYIKSCIYNAPLNVSSRIAVQTAVTRKKIRECREELRKQDKEDGGEIRV